ncbi:GCN5-related N-acetyltransferase [[Leptolyngbya] sp. PCC 7376]|uniref:GNAT family N-acetyltransferase n=1 Tax=[Leptolyngbya] sp. PCC 7376 TaxID=111781 RepID=UPI00029F15DA|nr:GNAT family N-acetyltransferase [[Leptolyngbya] sp. PCC 7376]AFY37113.1 GCN5-related N-acetyltransferase [[Leptolyngbya] sp. PCC 7376]
MIRATKVGDAIAITELAAANHFEPDEIELVQGTLESYLKGESEELWFSAFSPNDDLVGVLYCTPEPMTRGTWNILMILVHPGQHRQGYGKALMSHVETTLLERNTRLIIVETSSLDDFANARAFYPKCGYTETARIPDFYEAGSDKIIFRKDLAA